MLINIREVFNGAVPKLSLSGTIPASDLWQTGSDHADGISVSGFIENRSGIVRLYLDCTTDVNEVCDRCLTEFSRLYIFPIEKFLITDANSDSDEYLIVDGVHLDLTDTVVDSFLEFHPAKILCKDDCLGLDPETGENLNRAAE
jgi:uncharacterized protein